jgi:hypothetical protein
MPVKSRAQFRLMQAAAHGGLNKPGGPSKAVAKEFLAATPSPKSLPEKATKRREGRGR